MPVPTEELKLEIVNAATGETLDGRAAPGQDGALVVRELPEGGPAPEQWQIVPVQSGQDEQVYVIRNAAGGEVLEQPAAAGGGVRQANAADGRKTQQWRLVPVEGEVALYFIESAADDTVLDLDADPGVSAEQGTPVVVRAYDEDAESQRWRLVPAERPSASATLYCAGHGWGTGTAGSPGGWLPRGRCGPHPTRHPRSAICCWYSTGSEPTRTPAAGRSKEPRHAPAHSRACGPDLARDSSPKPPARRRGDRRAQAGQGGRDGGRAR